MTAVLLALTLAAHADDARMKVRHGDIGRLLRDELGYDSARVSEIDKLAWAHGLPACGPFADGFSFYERQCKATIAVSDPGTCRGLATALVLVHRVDELERGLDRSTWLDLSCGAYAAAAKVSPVDPDGGFHQGQVIVELFETAVSTTEPITMRRYGAAVRGWTAASASEAQAYTASAPARRDGVRLPQAAPTAPTPPPIDRATAQAHLDALRGRAATLDASAARALEASFAQGVELAWWMEAYVAARGEPSAFPADPSLRAGFTALLEGHRRAIDARDTGASEATVRGILDPTRAAWTTAISAFTQRTGTR